MAAERYVLWGSAGHAKVLAELIALRGGQLVALFDNDPLASAALAGLPLYIGEDGFRLWTQDMQDLSQICALVAIGGHRGRDRLAIHALMRQHGLRGPPVVHPQASVSDSAALGQGSQVLAQAIVAAEARLGDACIVNHRASVDHECVIGNGVHLGPAVTLCGCVTVGDAVFIGAGAVVLPRVRIGEDAIVGAGAVVTRDVPPRAVVVGNPARIMTSE